MKRLRVHWFDAWHTDLDDALRQLPEMDTCPHDLYRELLCTPGPTPKRIALVDSGNGPLAVVGLKRHPSYWMPITSWIVPGVLFPMHQKDLVSVITALRVPLFIAWWRQPSPPPQCRHFGEMEKVPTHKLSCVGDYEEFWRRSSLWRDIRSARKKCAHLSIVCNAPGSAEWTIRQWERKWMPTGSKTLSDASDRMIVARYWEPRGRQYTFALMDGERIAGSDMSFAHGTDIVGIANYRDPTYDKLGVGTRLIDAVQQWAASAGFHYQDFGGGHDYKRRWAPEDGYRWQFTVKHQTPAFRTLYRLLARLRPG